MGKKRFIIRQRVSLGFLGDDWKDCYVMINPASPADLRHSLTNRPKVKQGDDRSILAINDFADEMVKKAFISGKGFTEEGIVDLDAEDVCNISPKVTARLITAINGEVDPN